MNVLQYQAVEQASWDAFVGDMGYERISTFYGDLSIAEFLGEDSIRDTYKRVMNEWMGNVKYITEFIMCLNHKIWELYEGNQLLGWSKGYANAIARLYNELWEDAEQKFFDRYQNDSEAMDYYYRVMD